MNTTYRKEPIAWKIDEKWRTRGFPLEGLNEFIESLKEINVKSIVEIGSYLGDSTVLFSMNFDLVFSIDPYINGYDDKDPASYKYDMFDIETNFMLNTRNRDNIIKMSLINILIQ